MWFLPHILTIALVCAHAFASITTEPTLHNHHQQNRAPSNPKNPAKRLAIIGAGAAGSSTAYFAAQYALQTNLNLSITIYEANPYIGGRSTTVNVYDDPNGPTVEVGASIFVKINRILYEAATSLNLSGRVRYEQLYDGSILSIGGEEEGGGKEKESTSSRKLLGIWDGSKFVYEQSGAGGFWDILGLFYKYGLSVLRARSLMKSTIGKFLKIYEEPTFPFVDLTATIHELDLAAVVSTTGAGFLRENGVSDKFANELVQASTRVNYAANLGGIHGVETMVCLATDDAMSIEGGNWRIFEGMVQESGAELRLRSTVTDLVRGKGRSDWKVLSRSSRISAEGDAGNDEAFGGEEDKESDDFDAVVLAAPYQFAGIRTDVPERDLPQEIPYVTLHVTLFTSKRRLAGSAFGLTGENQPPLVILTTLGAGDDPGKNGTAVGSAGFFSISTLRSIINPSTNEPEYLYKIFSPSPVNNTFLAEILGLQPDQVDDSSEISWIYRKVWQSYPQEAPRTSFNKLRIDKGLWYTSGIEGFISTMETSALSGKNVAKLVVDGWMRAERCLTGNASPWNGWMPEDAECIAAPDAAATTMSTSEEEVHDWEL